MSENVPGKGPWMRLRQHFRSRVISGFLFLLPIGITILIIRFIYTVTAGLLARLLNKYLGTFFAGGLIVAISIITSAFLIYLLGLITTHVIGRKLVGLGEAIILKLPILKTVYGASKQVVETFRTSNRDAFKSVVMLEFPRTGCWTIGFATGVIENTAGEKFVKIYLPTTPNPTTGFFLLIPQDQVILTDFSIEEGIKLVVSGGILGPNIIPPLR